MSQASLPRGPVKAIYVNVPVGVPTADGGLEIPNRVFLGGIPSETTELELELFFGDYGTVKDVRIVTDRVTGECKGYGFVTFDENEDISKLVTKKSILMKGRKLRIRKAVRRNGSQFPQAGPEQSSSCSSSLPSSVNTFYLVPVEQVPHSPAVQYGYMSYIQPVPTHVNAPPSVPGSVALATASAVPPTIIPTASVMPLLPPGVPLYQAHGLETFCHQVQACHLAC